MDANPKDLFNSYRERSTAALVAWNLEWTLKYGDKFYPTPSGKQVFAHDVGDTVTTTGTGTIKAGIPFVIEQRQKDNGFCNYYGLGTWHRQQDVTANG